MNIFVKTNKIGVRTIEELNLKLERVNLKLSKVGNDLFCHLNYDGYREPTKIELENLEVVRNEIRKSKMVYDFSHLSYFN